MKSRNRKRYYDFLFKMCKRCWSLICVVFGVESIIKYMHALRIIYVCLNWNWLETSHELKKKAEKCVQQIVCYVNVMTTQRLTGRNCGKNFNLKRFHKRNGRSVLLTNTETRGPNTCTRIEWVGKRNARS